MKKGEIIKWSWTYKEVLEYGWYHGIYISDGEDGTHKIKNEDGSILDVEAVMSIEQTEQTQNDVIINLLEEIRDLLRLLKKQ